MNYLLSADPGLSKGVGLGLFEDAPKGELLWGGFVPGVKGNDLNAYRSTAARVLRSLGDAQFSAEHVNRVAVEWPQVYAKRKGKGDPKWMVDLAAVDCFICALFPRATFTRYLPSEWKGNAKASKGTVKEKEGDLTRQRVMDRLSPEEVARIVWPAPYLRDNLADALGIGLKAVGRFEPIRLIAR